MAVKRRMYAKDIFFGNSDLDVFSGQMVVVGTLLHGQPSGLVGYFNPPRYRAFRFAAAQDDRLDIWVGCEDGDAVAWVLDTNYRTLAWNDDARVGNTNSHISLTIPSTQPVFYLCIPRIQLAVFTLPGGTELAWAATSGRPNSRCLKAGFRSVIETTG